jgi:hypothetical protein
MADKKPNLRLVERTVEDDIWWMFDRLSPESQAQLAKDAQPIFAETLINSMSSSKEVIAWRDKNLSWMSDLPDLKENVDRIIVEKKRSEFKGIKGGADRGPRAEVNRGNQENKP